MPGDSGPMATVPGVCRIRANLARAAAAVARGPARAHPGRRHPQGRVGTTYRVLVREQNAVGDGTWDTSKCPGLDAPQVEMTVTRGADSASNTWTLHAPRGGARVRRAGDRRRPT